MKNIIYWSFCIVFFFIYFQIFKLIWNMMPFNIITDIISIFIIVVIIIPLSAISAHKLLNYIKERSKLR